MITAIVTLTRAPHQLDDAKELRQSFTFVDLFAGIGGTRIAFERAGGKCLFSSEWDSFACQTYKANFGERPAGDITKIPTFDIPQHDVLVAGFPCQPFSIAGVTKHKALGNEHGFRHATQGTLFFDVARIIETSRPRAFLLENVKNLLSHDRGRTFQVIRKTLEEDLGYSFDYQVIDARWRVPQHRERLYMVGFREDVAFNFPTFSDERPHLWQILEPEVSNRYLLTDHLWGYLQEYARKHRSKGNGFGYSLITDPWGVTRTLSARYYKDGSEILIPTLKGRPRRLTPRECARLMGFPDTFKIPVSDTQAYRQFGNSVVVPVVEAIANAIAATLVARRSHDTYVNRRVKVTLLNGIDAAASNGARQAKLLETPAKLVYEESEELPVARLS